MPISEKDKLIVDVRFYEGTVENIDCNSQPDHVGTLLDVDARKLNAAGERLILKLREASFCLSGFNHVYVNFTSCLKEGEIAHAKRSIDTYHPFFRYVDIGLSPEAFNALPEDERVATLISATADALVKLYCKDDLAKTTVRRCADEILKDGDEASIVFKQKSNGNHCVKITARILDNGLYVPAVSLYDSEGVLIETHPFKGRLTQDGFVFRFGSIYLGKTMFSIKPKRSVFMPPNKIQPLKYPIPRHG